VDKATDDYAAWTSGDRHAEAQRVGDAVHAAIMDGDYIEALDHREYVRKALASVAYTAAVRAVLDDTE